MKRFSVCGVLSPLFCGAPVASVLVLAVCFHPSNELFGQAVPSRSSDAPSLGFVNAAQQDRLPPVIPKDAGTQQTADATAAASTATVPVLGVNIGWVTDWDSTQMFADAMKQARKFGSADRPYDEAEAIDAQGWPLKDAGVAVIVGNQGAWSVGRYALSFNGQANVTSWADENVNVGPVTYDSATNTSTATVTVGPAYQNVYLVFTKTRRTPASGLWTGVTNISLMRPTVNGTPHAPGTLFTDRFLQGLKYFSAIRMMDYLNTNSSTESLWSQRSIPAYASQQQIPPHASQNLEPRFVTGGSYEYAIQLANQADKDLWLNVPHLAFGGTYQFLSTQWATNLALLVKYGSDSAGNPYTGPSGSDGANPQPKTGPVNPGLKAGLHVYLEYSNEFWSGVGNQTVWIKKQARTAIDVEDKDLDWDHDTNMYDLMWRINAKGVMLIAQAFESVYGAAGFGTVYRPVLAGQIANVGTLAGMEYLDKLHGGANRYVWAIAGAPYVDFEGDTPGNKLLAKQIIGRMEVYENANIVPWIGDLASLAAAEKLEGGMLAYEGGQGTLYSTPGSVAAQTNRGMRALTTALLDSWFGRGGGTFFYYKLCSADNWGLAATIGYDIDQDRGYSANPDDSTEEIPKWGAIKQVATEGH